VSRLQDVIADELTRTPPGPSATELHRRAAVRRVRRVGGSVVAIALVVGGLAIGASLRTSDDHHIVVTQSTPTTESAPSSTTLPEAVEAPGLGAIPEVTTPRRQGTRLLTEIQQSLMNFVGRHFSAKALGPLVESTKIVKTTRGRAASVVPGLGGDPAQQVYLVQLVGIFPWVCYSCAMPADGVRVHGRVATFVFDTSGHSAEPDYGTIGHDLAQFGTVYRIEISWSVSR
jgi:hypothetical protein